MSETTSIRPLTRKQELFCHTYIELKGNATQAYKKVYGTDDDVSNANGARLLANASIVNRIKELSIIEDAPQISRKERVIREMELMAFESTEGMKAQDKQVKTKNLELLAKIDGTLTEHMKHDVATTITFVSDMERPDGEDR